MSRPFSLFVGLRYTSAKRRNHFISFISFISIMGVALGVMVLITVLSVMNGFDNVLKSRILAMTPHVTLYPSVGHLDNWHSIAHRLMQDPGVEQVQPFIEGQALLSSGNRNRYVYVTGITPSSTPTTESELAAHMVAGKLTDLKSGEFGLVIGQKLADQLGLVVGSQVTLVVPEARFTIAGVVPRVKRLRIVGLFQVGYTFDTTLAFINLRDAATLYRLPTQQVSGLHVRTHQPYDAPTVAHRLANDLGSEYVMTDWTRRNSNFFRAVKMEKTLMFVLLLFIVLVATFNILVTLVMLVTEKKADIAILRTMGATPNAIMRIFLIQGTVIGLFGTAIGLVAGVLLASHITGLVDSLQQMLHTELLSADVYYISFLPSEIRIWDVVVVAVCALVMSVTFTLYPALSAARVAPAEALRYE